MLPGALDKTPLSIYASALSMHLTAAHTTDEQIIEVGIKQGEFAARLPNTLASIVLIALIYKLSMLLYDRHSVGLLAAGLAATSPFLIVFSASAFTDVLMLMFMVGALVFALKQKPGWSGIFLALSIASKQQGIFYLPLIATMIYLQAPSYRIKNLSKLGLTLLIGIALLLLWDSARPEDSLFSIASANNNPERLFINSDELLPRLKMWMRHMQWVLGPGWLAGILMLIALPSLIFKHISTTERILWGYVGVYLVLHWIVAFNTYDRYLLPIAPLLIVLIAGNIVKTLHLMPKQGQWIHFISIPVIAILCGFFAIQVTEGKINTGRNDYPRQNDMTVLADFLNNQPLGTIIYDHWLGWELDYYLGAWTDKRRVYYPEPQIMAQDALKNPETVPRYLVAPSEAVLTEWLYAFKLEGFEPIQVKLSPQYQLYGIIPAWVDATSG